MSEADQVKEIRRRLRRAYLPFFGRFGTLTPIQREAIPRVLAGSNVVVASPTASGKTEAVVAPVAEALTARTSAKLSVVYVVPTRALGNDTLARIEGPLSDMGITTALKHGDRPQLPRPSSQVLITTPESLDSLICRQQGLFRDLQELIIDEIHLLDNTYRGDQLRVLLKRLRQLSSCRDFKTHLLSATLADAYQVARRYTETFEVVQVPGRREIDYLVLDSLADGYALARERGWKKVLCFCNKRESVEEVAAVLGKLWSPYPVLTHHGSLSRNERESTEAIMKQADVAVCVATSTLEVGIDIGDVDFVLVAEVPWSITSLLQRIGRGNRRKSRIHAGMIAQSEAEKAIANSMFEAAARGEVLFEHYVADLGVAVQQIFSCLFQHPHGLSRQEILDVLQPICSESEAMLILSHLCHHDWVEQQIGRCFATERLMNLGEKGKIHSNIPDMKAYRVVDADSGREIGKIAGVFDEVFVLARRAWKVMGVQKDVVKVRHYRGRASSPAFRPYRNASAFSHLLPPKLQTARDDPR